MRRSDRLAARGVLPTLVPSLPNLCAEAGNFSALICKGFPNLPNLPNLRPAHAGAHPHPRARTRVCTRQKKVGKVGKVGNKQCFQGFWLPNLAIEGGKAGKRGGKSARMALVEGVPMDLPRVIDQMRADFVRAGTFRIERGEWSQEDADQLGAAVKVAIERNDGDAIHFWSQWLAAQAAAVPREGKAVAPALSMATESRLADLWWQRRG